MADIEEGKRLWKAYMDAAQDSDEEAKAYYHLCNWNTSKTRDERRQAKREYLESVGL